MGRGIILHMTVFLISGSLFFVLRRIGIINEGEFIDIFLKVSTISNMTALFAYSILE